MIAVVVTVVAVVVDVRRVKGATLTLPRGREATCGVRVRVCHPITVVSVLARIYLPKTTVTAVVHVSLVHYICGVALHNE
jgi:hypothetical protein